MTAPRPTRPRHRQPSGGPLRVLRGLRARHVVLVAVPLAVASSAVAPAAFVEGTAGEQVAAGDFQPETDGVSSASPGSAASSDRLGGSVQDRRRTTAPATPDGTQAPPSGSESAPTPRATTPRAGAGSAGPAGEAGRPSDTGTSAPESESAPDTGSGNQPAPSPEETEAPPEKRPRPEPADPSKSPKPHPTPGTPSPSPSEECWLLPLPIFCR